MKPDTRWTRRAVALLTQNEVRTALHDYGHDRMTLLDVMIQAALKDPRLPLPGDPSWDEFFSHMLEDAEQKLGRPLDTPGNPPAPAATPQAPDAAASDPTVTVAMTGDWDPWRPRFAGRRNHHQPENQ